MDLEGLARIKRDWMPSDGMLTLGICSRNVGAMSIGGAARGMLTIEMAKKDWGGARALGLPITLHTSGPSPIRQLDEAGLLGPDVQLVHPLLTTPEERAILKARGVSYSIVAHRRGAPSGEPSASSSSANCWRPASRSACRPTTPPTTTAIPSSPCASCSRCISTASATRSR